MRSPVPTSPTRACAGSLSLLLILGAPERGRAEEPLPDEARLVSSPVLRHLRPNPVPSGDGPAARETLRQMHVPEGFRVDLVASEPDLEQPIAFAWDERGRIWVAEALSYPTRRPEGEGLDRLLILSDADGDGAFETRRVFASGLNLVSGFEVGHGGVWVGAAPELLFIPDRDRDDVPDGPAEVVLDGFGFQDTHECLNSFHWGPDGWLYGIQGVFNRALIGRPGSPEAQRVELRAGVWRLHPVRRTFEVFAHGGSNPWGLDHDADGELFMTHCRSYWGGGGTTHVIQGGHFWNQANAHHAPFIVGHPPEGHPEFRNYLMASARYDHGAGGAGKPGSDAIYGGHSHVGTLLYQGTNWPAEYRGHLFTHNLHGHQINQQVNLPEGSGYNTVHAGRDAFFCSDPKYVAVDLQTGPDGAVYLIDWYDRQHCHNPDTERWERGSGRVYRMRWEASWRPASVDLGVASDAELVGLLVHPNSWHARTAQRLLHERAVEGRLAGGVARDLRERLGSETDPERRLRFLWALHGVGGIDATVAGRILGDADPRVRRWGVQLLAEEGRLDPGVSERFVRLARADDSPVVRRQLASAAQRLPEEVAWPLLEALAGRSEDAGDRNLPALIWQGIAPRMARDPERAFALAAVTTIPRLTDWIHWYGAVLGGSALDRTLRDLESVNAAAMPRRLAGLWLALAPQAGLAAPGAWRRVSDRLYADPRPEVRRAAERVGAVFGDTSRFGSLRAVLADADAPTDGRRHAFEVLSRGPDPGSLPVFLALLADPTFRPGVLPVLSRFESPAAAREIVALLEGLSPVEKGMALETLTSRSSHAGVLLQAVADGRLPRETLTSHHVRRLRALGAPEIDAAVAGTWGRIRGTASERQAFIDALRRTYDEAPLWAYSGNAGRGLFQRLCASCHVLGPDGQRLGPELTGAGRNGIGYFLENIVDPNAVVGSDFQQEVVTTRAGDVISGLLQAETPTALTLQSASGRVVVPLSDIVRRERSPDSLMPEGLLEGLAPRERLELLKYLTGN